MFFVRFNSDGLGTNSLLSHFQLVEVNGYFERVIDEGSSSGCTIHFGDKYVSMRVISEKIGRFEFYCHCDEKTAGLLMQGKQ
jgi:hypothetical protein